MRLGAVVTRTAPRRLGPAAVGARVVTPQAVVDAAAARFDARGARRGAAGRRRGEFPARAPGALPAAGPVFDVAEAQVIDRRSPG